MWRAIYHEFRRWAKMSGSAWAAYRRIKITVETDQVLIIRRHRSRRVWCAECCREVDMVELKLAGALLRKMQSAAWPVLPGVGDRRGWHEVQATDGSTLVCLESLRLR